MGGSRYLVESWSSCVHGILSLDEKYARKTYISLENCKFFKKLAKIKVLPELSWNGVLACTLCLVNLSEAHSSAGETHTGVLLLRGSGELPRESLEKGTTLGFQGLRALKSKLGQ